MTEQTTILLNQLINQVESYLRFNQYNENTIMAYRNSWLKLVKEYDKLNVTVFSYEICETIIRKLYKITQDKKLTTNQVIHIRTIKILKEFSEYGYIKKCYQKLGAQVNENYKYLLDSYIAESEKNGLSKRTILSKKIQITQFLNLIFQNKIDCIKDLSTYCVLDYVNQLKQYSRSTRSGILFTLNWKRK